MVIIPSPEHYLITENLIRPQEGLEYHSLWATLYTSFGGRHPQFPSPHFRTTTRFPNIRNLIEEEQQRIIGYDMTKFPVHDNRVIDENGDPIAGPSCGRGSPRIETRYQRPPFILMLGDSYGGNTNQRVRESFADIGVASMRIPEGTTGDIQPLDVGFFRQFKYFVRRLSVNMGRDVGQITSREGSFNMLSVIWNQFSSPVYEGLIRRSWRGIDESFDEREIPDPDMLAAFNFLDSVRVIFARLMDAGIMRS